MNIVDRIRALCSERKITIAELERNLGLGAGTVSRWDARVPGTDKIQKVAEYFDVSTDYLLGRSDIPKWATNEDVIVFDQALKRNSVIMSYNGIELSEEDKLQLEGMIKAMLWEKIQQNKGGN
nr:MAG TPA: repressor protein [Caudoviricetes sp.]